MKLRTINKLIAVFVLVGAFFGSSAYAACNANPIIFVHGYAGNNFQWDPMIWRFKAAGYPSCALYKFGYNSLFHSNKKSAGKLNEYVNWVRSRHGNKRVDIVTHSNGGLVARWFKVFKGGSSKTDSMVNIAAPHKGTEWARVCPSPACREMTPNSSFLKDLAGRGCDVSLWAWLDEIIIPNTNAKCGTSYNMGFYEHNLILNSKSVYKKVKDNL